jgi:DNA invertase Pin-like site-specific DNA recombinase
MADLGVAYYRVSTKRQGASGLGLDAQVQAVRDLVEREGIDLLDSFTEVESGTGKASRPKLEEAVALCRERDAVLLIAKLDRLARNVHFLSGLMESGVRFKACDIPQADEFTVHILAAVAQQEAKAISARTKAALEAARARGVKLGSPKGFAPGIQELGNQARAEQAKDAYDGIILDHVCALRDAGMSYGKIAGRLNGRGVRTRRGKNWTAVQVRRLYLEYC